MLIVVIVIAVFSERHDAADGRGGTFSWKPPWLAKRIVNTPAICEGWLGRMSVDEDLKRSRQAISPPLLGGRLGCSGVNWWDGSSVSKKKKKPFVRAALIKLYPTGFCSSAVMFLKMGLFQPPSQHFPQGTGLYEWCRPFWKQRKELVAKVSVSYFFITTVLHDVFLLEFT